MGMSDDLGDLTARLKLDTSDAESAVAGVARSFPVVGAAAAAVTAAVLGTGGAAVDMAAKFQSSTDRMAASAGITQQAAAAIGDAFLSTAGQTTFSAEQIMQAYAPVAGQLELVAGHALNATDSLTFMSAAQNLAEASGAALGDTTAGLAAVMQAYQIPVSGAAQASDLLFNASRALNTPVSDLAGTIDKLHAKLGPLAPSLSDVSSLLLDVESHGLTGNRALLLVSTGLNTLLGGAKATDDEIANLGLTLYNAQGQFVGMASVIDQLQPKLAGMTEEQRLAAEKTLFGAGASKALDDTIMAGLPAFDAAAAAAQKHGTAAQGAATATDNLHGSIEKIKAGFDDAAIKLGQGLLPMFQQLADWIGAHQSDIQNVAKTIGTDLANGARDAGQFIQHDLWPGLQDVGGFLADHTDQLKLVGETIAGWYVAKKGASIFSSLKDDVQGFLNVVGKITGTGGTGLSGVGVPHVWVDNMPPGLGGDDGGVKGGAAGGAAATGRSLLGALGGLPSIAGDAGGAGIILGTVGASGKGVGDSSAWSYDQQNAIDQMTESIHKSAKVGYDIADMWAQYQTDAQHTIDNLNANEFDWASASGDTAALNRGIADLMKSHALTSATQLQSIEDAWNKGVVNADNLSTYVGDWKAVTANQGALNKEQQTEFNTLFASGITNAGAMADMMKEVGDYSKKYGPPSASDIQQMAALAGLGVTDVDQIHNFLKGAIPHASDTSGALKDLADALAGDVQAAKDLMAAIHTDLGSLGTTGVVLPHGSDAIVPHWSGGFIPPGAFGTVNEIGPELMYGGPYGTTVFPRGGEPAGAGGNIYLTVNVQGAAPSADEIARAIGWEMSVP